MTTKHSVCWVFQTKTRNTSDVAPGNLWEQPSAIITPSEAANKPERLLTVQEVCQLEVSNKGWQKRG